MVGSTVLRYDVFGDTVNVAARMEATGEVRVCLGALPSKWGHGERVHRLKLTPVGDVSCIFLFSLCECT